MSPTSESFTSVYSSNLLVPFNLCSPTGFHIVLLKCKTHHLFFLKKIHKCSSVAQEIKHPVPSSLPEDPGGATPSPHHQPAAPVRPRRAPSPGRQESAVFSDTASSAPYYRCCRLTGPENIAVDQTSTEFLPVYRPGPRRAAGRMTS